MVICVCNALSERACREAACRPECRTTGCVYRLLGARVRCGRCVPHMRALHEEARNVGGADGADAGAGLAR
jgi:bacterioferritin-associated ferredoxin